MAADFLPQETIRTKRDGGILADAEIEAFVAGVTDGSVTEGQVAAFAMAVLLKGMALEERVALTPGDDPVGHGARLVDQGSRRPGPGQAFDRRRRRQGQPDPRPPRSRPAAATSR